MRVKVKMSSRSWHSAALKLRLSVASAALRVMFTATLPLCMTLLNHGPPKSGRSAPAAFMASSFSRTGLHWLGPLIPLWYMHLFSNSLSVSTPERMKQYEEGCSSPSGFGCIGTSAMCARSPSPVQSMKTLEARVSRPFLFSIITVSILFPSISQPIIAECMYMSTPASRIIR